MGIFSIPTEKEAIRDFLKSDKEISYEKQKKVVFFGPVLFFFIIIAGLLNQVGIFPLSLFATFWRFWPAFLILAVLQIIFRKLRIIPIVVFGLGLGLVLSIIIYSTASINSTISNNLRLFYTRSSEIIGVSPIDPGEKLTKNDSVEAANGVEKRQLNITLDTGRISISDSDSENDLQVNSTYYENIGAVEISSRQADKTQVIDMRSQFDLGALLGGVEDLSYDIDIGNPSVLTDLNIFVGATRFDANLTQLNIGNFMFDLGTGIADIDLSKTELPSGDMDINVNTGLLTLKIPFRSFTKINFNIGTGRLRINDQVFRQSGSYTTTNFRVTTVPKNLNLTIKAGDVLIDTRGGN